MIVEQAVFTSAQTQRLDGYQVVAASRGVSSEDCKSLARWCPAHDSLAEASETAGSINFHPLSGRNFCISRTSIAGAEYSGRGGGRVFTHCFIVSPQLMLKFSNNPFRVLEAITASGHASPLEDVATQLEPIQLLGRGSTIDRVLLTRLFRHAGRGVLPAIVGAAVREPSVCIVNEEHPDQWLAGLFSLLPVACRTQITFSTGLQFAARRPFRVMLRQRLPRTERQTLERAGVSLLDASSQAVIAKACTGWARLAHQMLASGKFAAWERILRCQMPGLKLEHLDRLAHEMLHGQS